MHEALVVIVKSKGGVDASNEVGDSHSFEAQEFQLGGREQVPVLLEQSDGADSFDHELEVDEGDTKAGPGLSRCVRLPMVATV